MAGVMNVSEGVTKQILREGGGPPVQKGNNITVQCTGTVAEGNKKFWSTKDPGQKPFSFQVGMGNVIAGWDEGCLTMRKGEIAKLNIAGHKGYGAQGFPAWGFHRMQPLSLRSRFCRSTEKSEDEIYRRFFLAPEYGLTKLVYH